MLEVLVVGLGVIPPSPAPLLLLKERNGERVLPIGIGPLEAQAIALPLQGVRPRRPMTHDVFAEVVASLGGHMRRVELTELNDNTFYARLVLEQGEQQQSIDMRPSDAVALAVRTETPIYVAEAVLDQAGVTPPAADLGEQLSSGEPEPEPEPEPEGDASRLAPFKEFIDSLDLDDLDAGGENRS
jgi:uncharacterized protein